jgi:hypothetical protein
MFDLRERLAIRHCRRSGHVWASHPVNGRDNGVDVCERCGDTADFDTVTGKHST